jgi:hypothetical protein
MLTVFSPTLVTPPKHLEKAVASATSACAGGMTTGTPQLSKSRAGGGLGARNCTVGTRRGIVIRAAADRLGVRDGRRRPLLKHYILCADDRRDNTFRRNPA